MFVYKFIYLFKIDRFFIIELDKQNYEAISLQGRLKCLGGLCLGVYEAICALTKVIRSIDMFNDFYSKILH